MKVIKSKKNYRVAKLNEKRCTKCKSCYFDSIVGKYFCDDGLQVTHTYTCDKVK